MKNYTKQSKRMREMLAQAPNQFCAALTAELYAMKRQVVSIKHLMAYVDDERALKVFVRHIKGLEKSILEVENDLGYGWKSAE